MTIDSSGRVRAADAIDFGSAGRGWNLVIHAGAGDHPRGVTPDQDAAYRQGLQDAYLAGEVVLEAQGSALDAVCAAVCSLEDNPLFNAGRGATLNAAGEAEHDASVMSDDGHAGAVATSRYARHPVLAARCVMERTDHVLIAAPPAELIHQWGLETADPQWFVTQQRLEALAKVQSGEQKAPGHGTVGAVALDQTGHLAAATSTGGLTNKSVGRIGDTPIVGAGVYARRGVVGVSCTGIGEAFLEGVVAHEVYAQMAYRVASLSDAVCTALDDEVGGRGVDGGIIGLDAQGAGVIAHNSLMMFAAWRDDAGALQTMI